MKIFFLLLASISLSVDAKPKASNESARVSFRLQDNRIFIPIKINGSGPFYFIYDTTLGTTITVSPELTKKFEVSANPNDKGKKSREPQKPFSIGNYYFSNLHLNIADFSKSKRAFAFDALDGYIGAGVFNNKVVCFDFDKSVMEIKPPGGDCFAGKETLHFKPNTDGPLISASVNGVKTELLLDVTNRMALTIFQKFSSKINMDSAFKKNPEVISGFGDNGPVKTQLANITELTIGNSIVIKNVLSRRPTRSSGLAATSEVGGRIGNDILRRFNLVIDYPKSEIRLVKNKSYNEEFKFVPVPNPTP